MLIDSKINEELIVRINLCRLLLNRKCSLKASNALNAYQNNPRAARKIKIKREKPILSYEKGPLFFFFFFVCFFPVAVNFFFFYINTFTI